MTNPNWKNQTIWTGDCLDIMRGMNSQSVNLIYLDTPFNFKAAELVTHRIQEELGMFFREAHRTDIPKWMDLVKVVRYNDIRNRKCLYGEQGGY